MKFRILITTFICLLCITIISAYRGVYIMPSGSSGCFGGQVTDNIEDMSIKASFSVFHSFHGHERGSATLLSGGQGRMLTAAHVSSPIMYVTDYTKTMLIKMRPVYVGKRIMIVDKGGVWKDDVAILEPDGPDDDPDIIRLKSMPGLNIAALSDTEVTLVRYGNPGGPEMGTSGSAVVNSDGSIIAVMTMTVSPPWPRNIIIGYGNNPFRLSIPTIGGGLAIRINDAAASYGTVVSGHADTGIATVASHPLNGCIVQKVKYEPY